MAWYDSILNTLKSTFSSTGSPTGSASAIGSIIPMSIEPNASTNQGPVYISPTKQVFQQTPQGAKNITNPPTAFAGPLQSSLAPSIPLQPTVVRPITTGVLTQPKNYLEGAATNPNIQWESQPLQPARTIYTDNPTNAPTQGQSGASGAPSTNSLSRSTATSYGGAGGGTFQGSTGMQGITSPNGTTGRSSAGTAGYNASNSVDIYGTQDEERKKNTENTLKTLIADLQGQLQGQFASNPSLLNNLEQFNPSATPNVNRLKAAEESAASLVSKLNDPNVRMTPEEANQQFTSMYTQSYQRIQQENPIPDQPVVPTPEQDAAEKANPTIREQMDAFRAQSGLPDLEKKRLDTINKLNAANETYNKIVESVKNNPEIPLSLQQRRIEEFTKSNQVAIKSLMGELDYVGQQISDANEKLNREFQIYTAEKSEEERKRDNNRALLGTAISTGALANFSTAQINQWSKLVGMDPTTLSQLASATRAKSEAVARKDEVAAEKADLQQQALIASITRTNQLIANNQSASGLSPTQLKSFENITDKYQKDEFITQALKVAPTNTIADQVIADPGNASKQLSILYTMIKNLDPNSAVREGELDLAQSTQSYLDKIGTAIQRVTSGKIISAGTAVSLANEAKSLAKTWTTIAADKTKMYDSQAKGLGIGSAWSEYKSGFQQTTAGVQPTGQPTGSTYKSNSGKTYNLPY